MNPLLGDLHLNQGEGEDDQEQNHRSCGGIFQMLSSAGHLDLIIDIVDDSVEVMEIAVRRIGSVKKTDDGIVLLESRYEGCDRDIEQLRGDQGKDDLEVCLPFRSRVDSGSIVILLIDALQSGCKYQ